MIAAGAGVLAVLIAAGLWLFYFSDRPETPPATEEAEEVREVDFSARLDDFPIDDIDHLDPDADDETEPVDQDEPEPEDEAVEEVFRDGLVNKVADMIFDNYFPARKPGGSSSFMLSFKMINMYFATDLSDFRVDEDDLLKARQEVMKHLLQPVVVDAVVRLYGPKLVERIVYLARNRERSIPTDQGMEERLLTKSETVDLLMLFSKRTAFLAHVFERSAAGEDVLDLVNFYLQTVDELRDVYFEYWQLDDDSQDQERERLGLEIKSLIEQREIFREKILTEVATTDMREAGHDYVYETQWVYRRIRVDEFSRDSIQALADGGKALSLMALDKAETLLEERTEDWEPGTEGD